MSSYSEGNDFNSILTRLLADVDDGIDKREGSIIYDALAPAAAELAQCYIALDIYSSQTFLLQATGENLDNRVVEIGLARIQATAAQAVISTYDGDNQLMDVDIGTRFAVPNENGGYNFKIISKTSTGVFVGECETLGTAGNTYIGDLLPLQSINNLGRATIISISKPGEDTETDSELRARALLKVNQEAFAGNKAAYRQMCIDIDGVEDCRIFSAWSGGGTVKIALVAPNHTIPSSSFVDEVQAIIDPGQTGNGIGLAPIGHKVTVVAPTADTIPITATLTMATGETLTDGIKEEVKKQIGNYFYQVQNDFLTKDTLIIYLSKVSAAILNVPQVQNVASLTINGQASDYSISITSSNIKYPILGTVTLS